jgi:deoxyinosine 3'endonuclease (endonuclease V)
MAIGVAPQILPGKAVTPANRTDGLAQEGRDVIEEVGGAVEQTRKAAKELAKSVPDESEARTVYDNTKRRASERRNAEIVDQNDGWRSDAFNL